MIHKKEMTKLSLLGRMHASELSLILGTTGPHLRLCAYEFELGKMFLSYSPSSWSSLLAGGRVGVK